MLSEEHKSENINALEANKNLIRDRGADDGLLLSPIDLAIGVTQPLQLEPLRWFNFQDVPLLMRLTNCGDTVIVSGKWGRERPYLNGGALEGNYVFSQIHFHWGSSEHEGSEHTVRGICYPMEMHVVFYKTEYLTQAAALRHDDGIVILAYLFRLQAHSSPGLHWLAGQLQGVAEPHTSSQVSPLPLASLLVPFTSDYITYSGAVKSKQQCRHSVMWLVSRAALAVSSEDLNLFRCLLNTKKEAMVKNFRTTSPVAGRTIFHVNPSTDLNNLLLPGAASPPCHTVMVHCALTPSVEQTERTVFEKGDSHELAEESIRGKSKPEKHTKSRLPIPAARQGLVRSNKKVIESRYASYFRPDTAPLYKTRPQTPTARPSTQR
ncbi:carbonic anhydrase 2-like [Macrosteles quadrilineatus]|uniref:carbonic anhydrase 2-like n=1 Tax=Macrosteles quadrilineatus TaxID=74068 RepID=UPI0023E1266C|nr:carbonic anhydrase 2-like [Macrosteles quadrilineatus]